MLGFVRVGFFGSDAGVVSEPEHPPRHDLVDFLRGALVLPAEAVQILLHRQKVRLILLVQEVAELMIVCWGPDLLRRQWPQAGFLGGGRARRP